MADDPALRMRRSRAHRAGDHQYCKPGCTPLEAVSTAVEGTGAVAGAARELVTELRFAEHDPRATMTAMVASLAEQVDRGTAPVGVIRELRTLLQWLVEHPGEPADVVDSLRVRTMAKRLSALLPP